MGDIWGGEGCKAHSIKKHSHVMNWEELAGGGVSIGYHWLYTSIVSSFDMIMK